MHTLPLHGEAGSGQAPFQPRADRGRGLRLAPTVRGRLGLLLLAVLVPILFLQARTHCDRFQSRRADEYHANLELARSVAAAFDAYVRAILQSELMVGLALTASPALQPAGILSGAAAEKPMLCHSSWISPQGEILASSEPRIVGWQVADLPFVQQVIAGQECVVSDLFTGRLSGRPAFAVARGIHDGSGALQGIAVAAVDPSRLDQVLPLTQAASRAIVILDRTGQQVFHYPPDDQGWQPRSAGTAQALIGRALADDECTGTFVSADGRAQMAGWAPIRSIGWVAGARRPQHVAMAPVFQHLLTDLGLLLLTMSGACLVAMAIARTLSVPLSRLQKQALAIGRGELGQRPQPGGPAELQELAAALSRMAEEIRQREEQREEYTHIVSHDLRGPLAAIHGQAELLLRALDRAGAQGRERQRALGILASARRMNAMIQDLVDSARLEAGRLELHLERVNLVAFIVDLKERLAGSIETGRIRLVAPESLPAVRADPDRLERVLFNLLQNALAYSPPQSQVTLALSAGEGQVVVAVADRGPGIAAEDLPHLFERYYRTRLGRERQQGLGLGLYIAKMLVEAHGGRIWVESEPGQGSTFYFALPAAGDDPPAPPAPGP